MTAITSMTGPYVIYLFAFSIAFSGLLVQDPTKLNVTLATDAEGWNLADDMTALGQLYVLYSDRACSFNQ